jgi:hypothetical protein
VLTRVLHKHDVRILWNVMGQAEAHVAADSTSHCPIVTVHVGAPGRSQACSGDNHDR